MPQLKKISEQFSVGPWLETVNFAEIREQGFDSVINFRPDGEASGQISSTEAEAAAKEAGLTYVHIPVTKFDLFASETVEAAARSLDGSKKTLGYCLSGQRAAIVWAAVQARSEPVDGVLKALDSAGFRLAFIRDDLEAQADRARWSAEAASKGAAEVPAAEEVAAEQSQAPARRKRVRVAA